MQILTITRLYYIHLPGDIERILYSLHPDQNELMEIAIDSKNLSLIKSLIVAGAKISSEHINLAKLSLETNKQNRAAPFNMMHYIVNTSLYQFLLDYQFLKGLESSTDSPYIQACLDLPCTTPELTSNEQLKTKLDLPIHLAAKYDSGIFLGSMLKAYPNQSEISNEHGSSALHIAAYHHANKALACLIEHDLQTHVLDHDKRTPIDVAVMVGNIEGLNIMDPTMKKLKPLLYSQALNKIGVSDTCQLAKAAIAK